MGKVHARRYPRLSVRVGVDYTAGADNFRGTATTLSGGGLFLTRVDGLEPGKEISMRFRPARHLPIIEARGVVRYIVTNEGGAVEFTQIAPQDHNRILRLIHQKTGDRRLVRRALLATQVESAECMSLAFSRDISLGGMFIETTEPLPVGSTLTVRFNLDAKDKVVKAAGHVAYVIENMGMGILFTEIDPSDRDAISEYMEGLPGVPQTGLAKAAKSR